MDKLSEEAAFRKEVGDFLKAHATPRTKTDTSQTKTQAEKQAETQTAPEAPSPTSSSPPLPLHQNPETEEATQREHLEKCQQWQKCLYENGWAGITWPEEFGGRGGAAWQQAIFNQEAANYGETTGFLGTTIKMAGAALMKHGTPEQQQTHLRPLLSGERVWCQLFSEPNAGSDLANLGTRAVLDGEEFVADGQKVWNSLAHLCDWAMLLARTDPDAPKHKGISFFLLDMKTEGVDPRPLRQITGESHFTEVFLNGVRIPKNCLLGGANEGWGPARTVLANEATTIGTGGDKSDSAEALINLAVECGVGKDPVIRQRLAQSHIREKLLELMGQKVQADIRQGKAPSIDGSLLKIYWSQNRQASGELAMSVLGLGGAARSTENNLENRHRHFWAMAMLNRFRGSIGGGTDEIHRNNLSERALGLPREPRTDKDVPWRELAGR